MYLIDRSFSAGLVAGLAVCLAAATWTPSAVRADEREGEIRQRDGDRDQRPRPDAERLTLERPENRDNTDRRENRQRELQGREIREREIREREMREHEIREREMREREMREREMREREMREREMREREMGEREREMHEREMQKREMHEREQMERREHEERERDRHLHAMEQELRELEVRRNHLELRIAEMELETRINQSISKADEAAFDAIKMASAYMEPELAADFLADLVGRVKSPLVEHQLRLRLAELLFRSDQPDRAAAQLRALIVPVHEGGH